MKEKVGLCEVCFNLAEGPRCEICDDDAPRPLADLRRRAARRRDPDRAHARVPRPLPRARRRALADRRHRPRGPEDRRAGRPGRRRRGHRGRARDQPDDDRRGDRAPHRRAPARQGRRSPASPAACRSAPTSSTPTRSPSAARFAGRQSVSRRASGSCDRRRSELVPTVRRRPTPVLTSDRSTLSAPAITRSSPTDVQSRAQSNVLERVPQDRSRAPESDPADGRLVPSSACDRLPYGERIVPP